jgi:hypothetical protein
LSKPLCSPSLTLCGQPDAGAGAGRSTTPAALGLCKGRAGVAGVARGDKCSLAPALDERPALVGLQGVVAPAEPVEQVEDGDMGLGPLDAVVGLQEAGPYPAAFGRAGGEEPVQGALLVGGGASAQVGHPGYALPLGEDGLQERVAALRDVPHHLYRHRAEAGHLAGLAVGRVATEERQRDAA